MVFADTFGGSVIGIAILKMLTNSYLVDLETGEKLELRLDFGFLNKN